MENENQIVSLSRSAKLVPAATVGSEKVAVYRFDIFRGAVDETGKVNRVKSVGAVYLRDGLKTYTVHLKTFLRDTFYLLPNTKEENSADFVILTREPAQRGNRKYFWNSVGEGHVLDGSNHGLLRLSWDLFSEELFMSLHPISTSEFEEAVGTLSSAS